MNALGRFASTRLTLVGMVLLGIGAAVSYEDPMGTSDWVLVVPLALLALNLIAALATNMTIRRRKGLLVFHIGLLGIVALAAVGRLSYLEAHVEMLEGNPFDPADLIDVRHGPWHNGALEHVAFIQGPYTVDYAPGMLRGLTMSHLLVSDGAGGWAPQVVGDDRPLVAEGYRFYTSFNKGFAPVLTWLPDGGTPVTGAIHMPSYPLFEFKQASTWTPGGGPEVKFWLRLETGLTEDAAWTLDGRRASGSLVVNDGASRHELAAGEAVRLPGGVLRYEQLKTWMGYKIFYDPTLQWMFVFAVAAVIGLASYLWRKFATLGLPGAAPAAAPLGGAPEGGSA